MTARETNHVLVLSVDTYDDSLPSRALQWERSLEAEDLLGSTPLTSLAIAIKWGHLSGGTVRWWWGILQRELQEQVQEYSQIKE